MHISKHLKTAPRKLNSSLFKDRLVSLYVPSMLVGINICWMRLDHLIVSSLTFLVPGLGWPA